MVGDSSLISESNSSVSKPSSSSSSLVLVLSSMSEHLNIIDEKQNCYFYICRGRKSAGLEQIQNHTLTSTGLSTIITVTIPTTSTAGAQIVEKGVLYTGMYWQKLRSLKMEFLTLWGRVCVSYLLIYIIFSMVKSCDPQCPTQPWQGPPTNVWENCRSCEGLPEEFQVSDPSGAIIFTILFSIF